MNITLKQVNPVYLDSILDNKFPTSRIEFHSFMEKNRRIPKKNEIHNDSNVGVYYSKLKSKIVDFFCENQTSGNLVKFFGQYEHKIIIEDLKYALKLS
jgi:hypothetical protein